MAFLVEQSGRTTVTRAEVSTWPEAVKAAKQFIEASTSLQSQRDRVLGWVIVAAGNGELVTLPNGKRLEISYVDED